MNIEQVRDQHEDALMRLANVRGVGIGEKAGQPAIKVLVSKKLPKSALPPDQVIPEELGGFAVDVEEIGDISAFDTTASRENPS